MIGGMANMAKIKTVPNQKVVKVSKEPCNDEKYENYYAKINLVAMSKAAIDLDAGAFKLWIYFAKNQNEYEFALSSKAVEENFGMKIKQYNNAIDTLTEKGYLVNVKGNAYVFNEVPVITKEDNDVNTFEDNDVITKGNKKYNTNTTNNTTNNSVRDADASHPQEPEEEINKGSLEHPYQVNKDWLIKNRNKLVECANGIFKYGDKYVVLKKENNEVFEF